MSSVCSEPSHTHTAFLSVVAHYKSYTHALQRVGRFLHVLVTRRVIFPHEVPKFSQLNLVLRLYKREDPRRFRANLRVNPDTFDALFRLIKHHPVFVSKGPKSQMPIRFQLAVALYRLGNFGSRVTVEAVAQWAGFSAGAVVKATRRVSEAFLSLHDIAIRWPTAEEKSAAADWIEEQTCTAWRPGFAMVDGTLIPLHAKPGHFGEQFFDRKSNYSLNLQVM